MGGGGSVHVFISVHQRSIVHNSQNELDKGNLELMRVKHERQSLLTRQNKLERERDKWMKEYKALKELSSQRMVSEWCLVVCSASIWR